MKYLFLEGPEVTTEDSARETRNDGLERRVSRKSVFMQRTILATLICGIMPGLMGLGFYVVPEKVSAAGYDITQISTMQEMQPYICDNTEIGQSNTLTDTRDNSTYTVAKLSDGKCWMTQNLRLTKESIEANGNSATLSSNNSDIIGNETFTLPSSDEEGFFDDAAANTYYGGDEDYGAYYSWCAATAGCKGANDNNPATRINATSSICPKGWRLPKKTEYVDLYTNYPDDNSKAPLEVDNDKNGFWFGANTVTEGGSFFPAAGFYLNSEPLNVNSYGVYWSSSMNNDTHAYYLYFRSSNIIPANNNYMRHGFSVRCVAGWPSQDVNVVAVRVAPVISIDAVSGMTEEVEPHKVTEGTISATVSANTTYDVLLSTNNTSLTNPENLEGPSIPATSPTNPVQPNTNAWGIKTSTNTYLPITTTPTSFYNTEQYDETAQSTKHTFTIGVSVAPSLPAGEYSTTVTITAVNN